MIGFWLMGADISQDLREQPFVATYFLCAVNQAGELEGSGEPAENIATAALTTCSEFIDAAAKESVSQTVRRHYADGGTSVSDGLKRELESDARHILTDRARSLVVTRIVTLRSKKSSK